MMQFVVRKNADDIASIPFYNTYGNGAYNALHDEYAPHFVQGTMSGLLNRSAKGNCTWWVLGRMQETSGHRIPLERRRGNAKDWLVDSQTPQVGAAVVFTDAGYGHIAFIEKIVGDDIFISESAYSERGNDFLFKYGRTVAQVCYEWGMEVKGYISPPEAMTSVDDDEMPSGGLIPQNGIFTVTIKDGLNVRNHASTSAERIDGLSIGESIQYDGYIDSEGIRWISWIKNGQRVYAARRKVDNSEVWGNAEFIEIESKPSQDLSHLELTPQNGLFTFTQDSHVLDYPDYSRGTRLTTYTPGEQVEYEGWCRGDGHLWLYYSKNGQTRFVAYSKNVAGAKDYGYFGG